MRVQKTEQSANRFTVRSRWPTEQVEVRTLNSRVPAVIRKSQDLATADNGPVHIFEAEFDLSKVPLHETVDLPIEFVSRAPATGALNSATFYVDDETGLLSCWLLLPEAKRYQNFDLLRYRSREEGEAGACHPSLPI